MPKQTIKKGFFSNLYNTLRLTLHPQRVEILLDNPDLYIDKVFFDRCLGGQWLTGIRYNRVKVGQFKRQIDKKIYLLKDLPLYENLEKKDKDGKVPDFGALVDSIKENGFDPKSVVICKFWSNLIKDGQHRAMYLLWRYGPDYEVDTIHLRVRKRLLRHRFLPWFYSRSDK